MPAFGNLVSTSRGPVVAGRTVNDMHFLELLFNFEHGRAPGSWNREKKQKVGRSTHISAYFFEHSSSRKKQLRTAVLTCTRVVYVMGELYKNENVVEGGFLFPKT